LVKDNQNNLMREASWLKVIEITWREKRLG